jgi:hypothetical protein
MFPRLILACLLLILVGFPTASYAAEQRCNELGANCVCSEPLNTNSYVYSAPAYKPSDSTTKECAAEGIPGAAVTRNSTDLFGSNDAAVRALLPAGNQVNFFLRGPDGHAVIYTVGTLLGNTFTKRAAIRMYVFYSPTFEFAYTNQCQNHKFLDTDSMITTMAGTDAAGNGGGDHSAYNWLQGWNHPVDCCFSGPNNSSNYGPPLSSYRGKWFRVEMVVTNRAGGSSPNGFRAQVFMKNVTDNTPEQQVIDTAGTFFSGIHPWGAWTDLTPPIQQNALFFNGYRQNICAGYYGFSHMMVAGWDTDAGQRIGAAYEIEGGGSPLAPPTDLLVR